MIVYLQLAIYIIAILAVGLSIFYSIKARRAAVGKLRGLYNARLNIAMGVMLVCLGFVQLFLFEFDSWIRIGVGVVFLLIGLFNMFAGFRNHAYFNRQS